jgi:hypothetical protein
LLYEARNQAAWLTLIGRTAQRFASSLSALPRARLIVDRPAYDLTSSRCR